MEASVHESTGQGIKIGTMPSEKDGDLVTPKDLLSKLQKGNDTGGKLMLGPGLVRGGREVEAAIEDKGIPDARFTGGLGVGDDGDEGIDGDHGITILGLFLVSQEVREDLIGKVGGEDGGGGGGGNVTTTDKCPAASIALLPLSYLS